MGEHPGALFYAGLQNLENPLMHLSYTSMIDPKVAPIPSLARRRCYYLPESPGVGLTSSPHPPPTAGSAPQLGMEGSETACGGPEETLPELRKYLRDPQSSKYGAFRLGELLPQRNLTLAGLVEHVSRRGARHDVTLCTLCLPPCT